MKLQKMAQGFMRGPDPCGRFCLVLQRSIRNAEAKVPCGFRKGGDICQDKARPGYLAL